MSTDSKSYNIPPELQAEMAEKIRQAQEQQQADNAQLQAIAMEEISKTGLPPWGLPIALWVFLKPMSVNNKHKIRRRKGSLKPFVMKTKEAEQYTRNVRAGFMAGYNALRKQLPLTKGPFEIDLRVDVFFQWCKADRTHGEMRSSDIDNLLKGVYDALQWGLVAPGVKWGLIKDDRQITEGFTAKGEAPEDGDGSRISVLFSRAGLRDPQGMAAAMQGLGALWPWTFQQQTPTKIITPGTGPRILLPGGGRRN
jgi:Holliday junction resolvase RusA-like endonuclease